MKPNKKQIESFKSLRNKLKENKQLDLTKEEYSVLKKCLRFGSKKILDFMEELKNKG